jgi:hypothetical protein
VKKIIAVLLIVLGLGCLIFRAGLIVYYSDALPRVPQSELGRIVPLNNHGTIVYLTELEQSVLTWMFFVGLALGLLGGIVQVSLRQSRK